MRFGLPLLAVVERRVFFPGTPFTVNTGLTPAAGQFAEVQLTHNADSALYVWRVYLVSAVGTRVQMFQNRGNALNLGGNGFALDFGDANRRGQSRFASLAAFPAGGMIEWELQANVGFVWDLPEPIILVGAGTQLSFISNTAAGRLNFNAWYNAAP